MDRKHLLLALGLLASGSAGLGWALHRNAHALSMLPATDGCLVVGLVAVVLALAEGLPWLRALVVSAPVFAIQVLATRAHGASTLAVMGLEAVVLGTIGLAVGAKGEHRVRRAGEPQPSRADVVRARDRRTAATRDSSAASSSPPFAPTSS